jgi:NAD-dependent SIR2 family protein deacetylase
MSLPMKTEAHSRRQQQVEPVERVVHLRGVLHAATVQTCGRRFEQTCGNLDVDDIARRLYRFTAAFKVRIVLYGEVY